MTSEEGSRVMTGPQSPVGFDVLGVGDAAGRCVALVAAVLLGLSAGGCDAPAPSTGVSVRDSLGVSLVEHPDWEEGAVPSLRLDPSPALAIGVAEGPDAYQFFGVTDALRRDDGSILVLDRSQTLRAYDRTGTYLWTAGGRGDGPGEFNWAQRIEALPGDTIAVWDVGPGRLSLFTGDGEFVRAWTVPGVAATALLVGVARGDQLILEQRGMERGVVGGHVALTVDSKLYWLDVAASRAEVVGQRRSSIQYQEVDENGAYSPAIFGAAAVFAPAPDGFWYGQAKAPELQRVSRDGGVAAVLRWRGTERAVLEADVAAVVAKWSSAPDATAELRRTLAEYVRTHPRADRFPPYEELRTDPAGNLWVRDFVVEHEDDGIRRWTVFSADGTQVLGRLEHEARFKPLRMTLDGVLGVDRDELGVERVAYRRVAGPGSGSEVRLLLAGQALIKKDPRIRWSDPYGTLRPIIEGADVAFTNFEMAVMPPEGRCGVPADYEVSLGTPSLPSGSRPGNAGGPHAVAPDVMDFLADLGFNLMSLSNNHAWDLGDCGVAATRATAEANGVSHAGTGPDVATASAPAYLTVGDFTIALVAATTSHDERKVIGHAVNGVWTGRQEDRDRNLAAVREAAAHADFVLYYQHFQIDPDEFSGLSPGDTTSDGHAWVDDVAGWQTDFAHAVLDAGASMYVGHGARAFDGVDVYEGKPLIRQLGGFAYQGLDPEIGAYDEYRPWDGLTAEAILRGGRVVRLEFTPLDLDEGETYRSDHDDLEFLSRRGLAQLATGPQADSILRRLRDLSGRYGVELDVSGSKAILDVSGSPTR